VSKAGDSPWDKAKSSDGPHLVDDGVIPDAGASAQRRTVQPADVEFAVSDASTGTGSRNQRRAPTRFAVTVVGAGMVALLVAFGFWLLLDGSDELDVEVAARSVAMVASADCEKSGSGSLVASNGLILTNSHVATEGGRDICQPLVGLTNAYDEEPTEWYQAVVLVDDTEIDLAVLQILDDDGSAVTITDRDPIPLDTSLPKLGDQIQTLGYPGIGGQTMTFTSGDFAGVAELSGADFYKTTASLNPGLSGGSAFNGMFELVGVPTAGFGAEVVCEANDCTSFGDSLGLIRPIRYALPLIQEAKRLAR
jgi:S1-C subfamily serine protease